MMVQIKTEHKLNTKTTKVSKWTAELILEIGTHQNWGLVVREESTINHLKGWMEVINRFLSTCSLSEPTDLYIIIKLIEDY